MLKLYLVAQIVPSPWCSVAICLFLNWKKLHVVAAVFAGERKLMKSSKSFLPYESPLAKKRSHRKMFAAWCCVESVCTWAVTTSQNMDCFSQLCIVRSRISFLGQLDSCVNPEFVLPLLVPFSIITSNLRSDASLPLNCLSLDLIVFCPHLLFYSVVFSSKHMQKVVGQEWFST